MRDPRANKADNSPCCSPETTAAFYQALKETPGKLYQKALGSTGELAASHPKLCHRRLFLLALITVGAARPLDGMTPQD